MTAEAALLGVPTLSCYPGEPTIVEKYLVREKLIDRICKPKLAIRRVRQILKNLDLEREHRRDKAKQLVAVMENPADVIVNHIEKRCPL